MENFLNEDFIPFKYCKELFCKTVFDVYMGKNDSYLIDRKSWVGDQWLGPVRPHEPFVLDKDSVYRLIPNTTPLDIPWEFVNERFKYAAMDGGGTIWFFKEEPNKYDKFWDDGYPAVTAGPLKINTDGIQWDKSLTKRPD